MRHCRLLLGRRGHIGDCLGKFDWRQARMPQLVRTIGNELFTPCVAKIEVNDPLNIGTALAKQQDSPIKP
jgi:hypothetical protein